MDQKKIKNINKKGYRIMTPPLNENDYLNDRINELEMLIEDKDTKIEDLYQEIIKLKDRIEIIEDKLIK